MKLKRKILAILLGYWSHFLLRAQGVKVGKGVKLSYPPLIFLSKNAEILIDSGVRINASVFQNHACSGHKMVFAAMKKGARIRIGRNSGMSCATLFSVESITIGENVNIGAGCQIFDTDFHPVDPDVRLSSSDHIDDALSAPVIIEDNVWLGAEVMILKGVKVGEGAVIAARSLVVKDVPPYSLAAGSPAKVIREIKNSGKGQCDGS